MGTTSAIVLVIAVLNVLYVQGDYELRVKTTFFENRLQSCTSCSLVSNNRRSSCCDDKTIEAGSCVGEQRCDIKFNYCLRSLGSTGRSCDGGVVSEVNVDDAPLNFTQDTLLGLSNPLKLRGLTRDWNGVELLITILDDDTAGEEEIVDTNELEITTNNVRVGNPPFQFSSTLFQATIAIEVTVACTENYIGANCTQCAPGFTGPSCININECEGVICKNGGTCEDGINSFTCHCAAGFTGLLCEVNIDECIGVNCSGNGQCVDAINSFTCVCNPGYTGQLCDIADCTGVDCSSHGQCMDGMETFTCNCDPGFTGRLCEVNIDDCVGVSCSGNGRCVDGIDSFSCVCNDGYAGDLCEEDDPRTFILYVGVSAGGVVLLLIGVIVVVMVAVTVKRKRRKRDRNVQSTSDIQLTQNQVYGFRNQNQHHPPLTTTQAHQHHNNNNPGPLITTPTSTWFTEPDTKQNKDDITTGGYDEGYMQMRSGVVSFSTHHTTTPNGMRSQHTQGLVETPATTMAGYYTNDGMGPSNPEDHDYDYIR